MPASSPDKSTLREQALRNRLAIPDAVRAEAAVQITENFLKSVPLKANSVIAGYWPVRGEADVLPLLKLLAERGYACCLPCVAGREAPLVFRAWDKETRMQSAAYGIEEPADRAEVKPDILIVPVLAFDQRRHRLGYGGGYYDRTLAHLKRGSDILAVGVAYAQQFLDDMPVDTHDHALDMIVTDRSVYK